MAQHLRYSEAIPWQGRARGTGQPEEVDFTFFFWVFLVGSGEGKDHISPQERR